MTQIPVEVGTHAVAGLGPTYAYNYGIADKDAVAAHGRQSAHQARDLTEGQGNIRREMSEDARDLTENQGNIRREASDNTRVLAENLCNGFRSVAKDVCDLGSQTLQGEARLQGAIAASGDRTNIGIEKTAAAVNLAIVTASNATNLAIEKIAAAAQLEAVRNAGAAALAAATNTASILAAMERCCCELKVKISEEGEKGRLLASSIERDAMRARLAVFEAKILTLPVGT